MISITINNLEVFTKIGVTEEEMSNVQRLLITTSITYCVEPNLKLKSEIFDYIRNVICYDNLCHTIRSFADEARFTLLETFTIALLESLESHCYSMIDNIKIDLEITKFPAIECLPQGVTCKISSLSCYK